MDIGRACRHEITVSVQLSGADEAKQKVEQIKALIVEAKSLAQDLASTMEQFGLEVEV